jgi:hypothetical protein
MIEVMVPRMTHPVNQSLFRTFATCAWLALSGSALGATYWVSPTGAASWAACQSATPLSGASACSYVTANRYASAGDTVYYRGGTYTLSGGNNYDQGIAPSNSGADAAHRIVFTAYPGETPVMNGGGGMYGFYLTHASWIKVDGFTFQDVLIYGYIINSSSYNEITNSTFVSVNHVPTFGIQISGTISCSTLTASTGCWNTHNWIHRNTFSKVHTADVCGEASDMIRIGSAHGAGNEVENDNFNTVEDNILSSVSHTMVDQFGLYNVIRNNISHNEPWSPGCTNWNTGHSSSTSLTVPTVTPGNSVQVTLNTDPGASSLFSANKPFGIVYANDHSVAMYGIISSYNNTTGQLVVKVYYTAGSGTQSSWILSEGNLPFYNNFAYNGLYGHRNFQVSDDYGRDSTFLLVEGNRIGHASLNPNNGGADNLDLAAPKNIVRYNFLYNSMASGLAFKYASGAYNPCPGTRTANGACGGDLNRVYNNTIYHSGYGWNWRVYGNENLSYNGSGIAQANSGGTGTTGNVVKNNIVYDNAEGDICYQNDYNPANYTCTLQAGWDSITTNWLTAHGDPKFRNPDLTQPASTTLPDLSLQATSPAIDGGTYLTQAVGAGTTSTTLVVQDALYFQDGTWGSDLARGVTFFPDWIAIGTVGNTVQISSINYATNTITLASPMTWSNNANIWLYKKSDGAVVLAGAAPDFGASEYLGTGRTGTPPLPPTNLQTTVH